MLKFKKIKMHKKTNKYLFNFSSSYSGGGIRRLVAFLDYFESRDGAVFVLNEKVREMALKYAKNNKLIFIEPTVIDRIFRDGFYLDKIIKDYGPFDIYYSYGIPLTQKVAIYDCFHISNLLPISKDISSLNLFLKIKMRILGFKIQKSLKYIELLTAESQDSLDKMFAFSKIMNGEVKSFTFNNGLENSIVEIEKCKLKMQYAITVGTQEYKDLVGLYELYKKIKKENNLNKLIIVGDLKTIPKQLRNLDDVECPGVLPHGEVLKLLNSSCLYISASLVENSSIASLEGLYFCQKAYLSDIGSHREMIVDNELKTTKVNIESGKQYWCVTVEDTAKIILNNTWNKKLDQFVICVSKLLNEVSL